MRSFLGAVQLVMCSVQCPMHSVKCPMHSVQCPMHGVQCPMHSAMCSVQYLQFGSAGATDMVATTTLVDMGGGQQRLETYLQYHHLHNTLKIT